MYTCQSKLSGTQKVRNGCAFRRFFLHTFFVIAKANEVFVLLYQLPPFIIVIIDSS